MDYPQVVPAPVEPLVPRGLGGIGHGGKDAENNNDPHQLDAGETLGTPLATHRPFVTFN